MANLDRKPTLVMGARGSVGKHVLDDLIALGVPVRAAARAAGVQRIVLMSSGSVVHPTSKGNPITEEHREVEDITVVPLTSEDALAHFSKFMPVEEAGAVLRFLDDAAAGNSPATGAVERILGRPGIPFAVWAADHGADFG